MHAIKDFFSALISYDPNYPSSTILSARLGRDYPRYISQPIDFSGPPDWAVEAEKEETQSEDYESLAKMFNEKMLPADGDNKVQS